MRILISAGGTGGGIYPALSVAKELLAVGDWQLAVSSGSSPTANGQLPTANRQPQILWIGSAGGMEAEIVARAGLPFKAIHSSGLHGVGWRLPLNALRLAQGFFEALRLVQDFQPKALLVTGGFVTAPVALAAWCKRVPILVYLPDIEPGLAVQFVSRLAQTVAVTAEDSRQYFAKPERNVVVTGYPTRPELTTMTRATAHRHFGLDPQRLTVLVTGGSRGARSLNRAVFAALPDWLKDYQVIHLSGQLDWEEVEAARAQLPEAARVHYHAFPFLHEMGLALAAADLVVSRAGASALGEYPLFGLPAILVPYPHAWRYQKVNADYLEARGAAVRLNDEDLPMRLASDVRGLLENAGRLAEMREAAQAAATPEAARRIAQELVALSVGAQREPSRSSLKGEGLSRDAKRVERSKDART